MARDDLTTTGGFTSSPETPPRAFQVLIDVRFDQEKARITVTSWSLKDFSVTGRDLFDLLDRLPAEIELWFHRRDGTEVLVLPVYSTHDEKSRRIDSSFVAVPIRPLAAALRAMEPKPSDQAELGR